MATQDEYGNKKVIEIDSDRWHFDIVKEQNRDDYLKRRGWDILHIRVLEMYKNPDSIIKKVNKFLAK
jgi:very-short-patch-repair endonuclease